MLDFGDESLHRAIASLAKIYSSLAVAEGYLNDLPISDSEHQKAKNDLALEKAQKSVADALNDDFNTPEVWAALYEVIRLYNTKVKRGAKVTAPLVALSQALLSWVREVGSLMSLFQKPAHQFLHELDDLLLQKMNLERKKVDDLVNLRAQARASKDFAKSDELRKQLTDLGISVMDLPQGSFWEVTK
jgi:cysteinyl-tRNA synthetase